MRSFCIFCILHGSVLAAKDDPRAYLIHTLICIYYPGSVLAAKSYPGVPYDQFWQ